MFADPFCFDGVAIICDVVGGYEYAMRCSITAPDSVLCLSMSFFLPESIKRAIAIIAAVTMVVLQNSSAEVIDYHQHLYSPQAGARSILGPKGIDADYLVEQLDAAGISRAVVLSVAYTFSNPNKPPAPDE